MISIAKRDARAFARWMKEAKPDWPAKLQRLGARADMSLWSLDQPEPGPTMIREAEKDLRLFLEAYAAWRAAHMASQGE